MAKRGRETAKRELTPRFQVAIDRAAMYAGLFGTDEYLSEWVRDSRPCGEDLEAEAEKEAARLEAEFTPEVLNELAANGGAQMTDTVVSSYSREVVIGFERPFVLIGERINPTGRKLLAEEMKNGDFSRVERDAVAQVAAGAKMLDVNAGIPLADEPALLAKAIELVQSLTDVPLSIDSSIVEALEAGLAVYRGKPLVNSVTGEEDRLERVLPLIAKYGAAVVAISNDETGISEDPDVRFEVARKIVNRAADYGIGQEDIVVDPLVMPIGAMATAGRQVFHLVGRLRNELGVNTTCGASNVSFGLPNRAGINAAFLAMAIGAGMTSAITNPLEGEIRQAILAADVLTGRDPNCATWIRTYREPAAGGRGTSPPRQPPPAGVTSRTRFRASDAASGPRSAREKGGEIASALGRLHPFGPEGDLRRPGPPSSTPPANWASTSTRFVAAGASAAAAR